MQSAKMSGQSSSCSEREPPPKKRCVAIRTVQKWIRDRDIELGTALWLKYEKYDREHVAFINCSICTTFDEKIRGSRNYSDTFVVCSTNLRTSSFRVHAKTEMHKQRRVKKSQGSQVTEYSPIAKELTTLDASAKQILTRSLK